jgi:RNA polymerase sigma-70 factor (sigma-E family)
MPDRSSRQRCPAGEQQIPAVARVTGGEPDAVEASVTFEDFVHEQLTPLLRFTKVLCGDRGLAEDVLQEVLLRAQARWSRLAELDKPDAYLRKMIVNEYLSWRRKWARFVPHAEVVGGGEVPDHAIGHADRDALAAKLATLPRRQRAVLVLRYYGGLSDPEIADTLGCGPSAVRAYASRALAALRVEMQATPAAARPAVTRKD